MAQPLSSNVNTLLGNTFGLIKIYALPVRYARVPVKSAFERIK